MISKKEAEKQLMQLRDSANNSSDIYARSYVESAKDKDRQDSLMYKREAAAYQKAIDLVAFIGGSAK